MNVGQIINQARILLQEPTTTFYTREELLDWLNEGQKQFCLFSNWLKGTVEIITSVGQREYNLSDKILKTEYVTYDNRKLSVIDIYELSLINPEWMTAKSGTPAYYYFPRKKVLGVYPPPDTANKTIRVMGIVAPDVLINDIDEPQIASEYHDSLVNFILYKAKIKDNSLSEATTFLTLFNNLVMQARTEGKWQDRRDKKYSFLPLMLVGR